MLQTFSLIFGGCCSNVFTFEKLLTYQSKPTNLITFVQFVFIAIEGFVQMIQRGDLKPKVPVSRWLLHVCFFMVSSNMNNYAMKLHVSVPVHVIIRSSGTIFTMLIGFCIGKRYNVYQATSGVILTAGLVLTSIGNSGSPKSSGTADIEGSNAGTNLGIVLLIVSSILISINGFLYESTYKMYPANDLWKEGMFYQHFLALPLFAVLSKSIKAEFLDLWHQKYALYYLVGNVLTQYICVRGVNELSSKTSSLTVSVVLLIRKFTSLVLSIVIFNNKLSFLTCCGGACIFAGALLYSYGKEDAKSSAKKPKSD